MALSIRFPNAAGFRELDVVIEDGPQGRQSNRNAAEQGIGDLGRLRLLEDACGCHQARQVLREGSLQQDVARQIVEAMAFCDILRCLILLVRKSVLPKL
ncbi:hypothetical protein OG2516_07188 [Oceanicola granulosus HTCC2516]|uniref:Uncharacterized protein n=1 Tax=Oceanicola granulosus (strain ATCC BAA-861 / DSM 15982 / KCTC 12143 / HTCC2516) TaxID=314256 RepID=Q2CCC2_OCEGH|nr:hypothetical protein OG2516_07188 [Oceanicola granulosus HTCC2516]